MRRFIRPSGCRRRKSSVTPPPPSNSFWVFPVGFARRIARPESGGIDLGGIGQMPQNMPPPSHQLQRVGPVCIVQQKRPEALLFQEFRPSECVSALNSGGAKEDRTPDLVIANDALSQLSYGPTAGFQCSAACRACQAPGRDGGRAASATTPDRFRTGPGAAARRRDVPPRRCWH